MREILFRGKKWETSVWDETDWIYGSLIDSGNHEQVAIYPWVNGASTMSVRQLVYARMENVKFETVGQYTGLKDWNGQRIFEGDIVRASNYLHPSRTIYVARFDDIGYYLFDEDGTGWHHANLEDVEVIGNIHDNPELLEGVKDEH